MNRKHVLSCSLLLAVMGLPVAVAQNSAPPASTPAPDAVIERWEQDWDLQPDGVVVYHELKHVRLNHERAYGEFADPRIPYNHDADTVTLKVARTRRADGTYVEVPDYSRNEVAPGGSAWPAFAALRQLVVTMSAIEPGCVVELEYEVRTKPGARRPPSADLRLDHRYPVTLRTVSATAPAGMPIHYASSGPGVDANPTPGKSADGRPTLTWTCRNLPANPDEPQAPPWQRRCPRLTLSFDKDGDAWLDASLKRIASAADTSDLIDRLAKQWTQSAASDLDKVRAIQEKMSSTFNVVDIDPTLRPAALRPASEVLRWNYGTSEEATALLLALARQAGVTARPALLVADDRWVSAAPQDALVVDTLIAFGDAKNLECWSAKQGRIARSTGWAEHTVLTLEDGRANKQAMPAWGDAYDNVCDVTGRIALEPDGKLSGKLTVTLSGLFVSSEALRTRDAQRDRLNRLIGRVVDKATVGEFTVTKLADGSFSAAVDIKSSEPVEKIDGRFRVALGGDGPSSIDVSLPLAQSARRLPVWLNAAFEERMNLTVDWPEAMKCQAKPGEVAPAEGEWGRASQSITTSGHTATCQRVIRIDRRELSPNVLSPARTAINALRSDSNRVFLIGS